MLNDHCEYTKWILAGLIWKVYSDEFDSVGVVGEQRG